MSAHPPSPAHVLHLVRRTLQSLRSRPLSPAEVSEVAGVLDGELAALFWSQPVIDQRHAYASARFVKSRRPGDDRLLQAALLHDIGKRHARLGVGGRILATVLALLRAPAPGRLGVYLDHPARGADDLAAAGADALVVAYARHQDDDRPAAIPEEAWAILKAADDEKHRLNGQSQYDGP
ncbi:MAG: hypothetical protein KJO87_04070 [Acidimicrobiia bacterium]|nr:hypothetical protein [Acidimicrobiia bacterium]NNL69082.1 hypothetical protein [Acidimicrobiia bacterium]